MSSARVIALWVAVCAIPGVGTGATITVTSLADSVANDGSCSLREAVTAANGDSASGAAVGECAAGSGADMILFAPAVAGIIALSTVGDSTRGPSALGISTQINIDGANGGSGIILQAGGNKRLFFVAPSGNLSLRSLTLSGGSARGGDGGTSPIGARGAGGGGGAGMGGAIFINLGTVQIVGCTLSQSSARGGDGGLPDNGASGFTGGGGAGGGGISGHGGVYGINGSSASGGGGGGSTVGNGSNGVATQGGNGGSGGSGGSAGQTIGGSVGGAAPGAGGGGGAAGTGAVFQWENGGTGGNGGPGGGGGGGGGSDARTAERGGTGGFGGGGGGGGGRQGQSCVNAPCLYGAGGNGGVGGGGGGAGGDMAVAGVAGFGAGDGGAGNGTLPGGGGGGAGLGGAIFNDAGTLVIENSTLSANSAIGGNPAGNGSAGQGLGAAVFVRGGSVDINHSTLADHGTAITLYLQPAAGGALTLSASLLATSTAGHCGGDPITIGSANQADDASCAGVAGGLTGLSPSLANHGGPTQTYALLIGSSAIDAAGGCALTMDQRGLGRAGACDSGAFERAVDLMISKTDGVTSAVPGQSVTYTIVASNRLGEDVSGAQVVDNFPAGLSCNWTSTAAGGASGNGSGSGNISQSLSLPAGSSVTYTAVCSIDPALFGTLSNLATISNSLVPEADNSNNAANDSDTLTPSYDLAISKTDGLSSATPGQTVIYAIVASNAGPSDAVVVNVSDSFPAECAVVTWTCVGSAGGSCAASGSGNINDNGFLPVGASISYSASCTIAITASGNLSNTATVNTVFGPADPDLGNNSATDTDTLTPTADLSISKSDGQSAAAPGQTVVYTIVASNAGPNDAVGSQVNDTFPAVCNSVAWTCAGSSGGSCTAAGSGDINDMVNLPVGASVRYSASCAIASTATGSLSNTATVATPAGTTDPNAGNNSATDTDTLTPTADLSISKTDNATTVAPGSAGTYVISLGNGGPGPALGSQVSDVFPANFVPGAWTCSASGMASCPASGSGHINATVDLPAGSTAVFTVSGTYGSSLGTVSNTATIAAPSGTADPDLSNNSASDTSTIASPASLSASKRVSSGSATAGGALNYTIVISNAGPQSQLDNPGPELVDVLPMGYIYQSASASSGSLTHFAATRRLEWSGALAAGQTVQIVINGNIAGNFAGGTISNQATLQFDADGNGSNEASALSDDPDVGGSNDATVIMVGAAIAIPLATGTGLLLMVLLIGVAGAGVARRN